MRTHPHAEATYRIVPLDNDAFGVEILIPDTQPVTVSSFATEAAAAEWIERKKTSVQSEVGNRKWFQRSRQR